MNTYDAETKRLLDNFMDLDYSSGYNTQPNDYDRWVRFVVSAHETNSDREGDELLRILKSGVRTKRHAEDLVEQYRISRRLLDGIKYTGSN